MILPGDHSLYAILVFFYEIFPPFTKKMSTEGLKHQENTIILIVLHIATRILLFFQKQIYKKII